MSNKDSGLNYSFIESLGRGTEKNPFHVDWAYTIYHVYHHRLRNPSDSQIRSMKINVRQYLCWATEKGYLRRLRRGVYQVIETPSERRIREHEEQKATATGSMAN